MKLSAEFPKVQNHMRKAMHLGSHAFIPNTSLHRLQKMQGMFVENIQLNVEEVLEWIQKVYN